MTSADNDRTVTSEDGSEVQMCPNGRTDFEECYSPFRYCPIKGCGRPHLPTYEEFGDDAPALRLRDMANRWAENRTNPHYSGATDCEHGEPVDRGWVELALETEAAHALLDWLKVPDGHPQGGGDIDTRMAKVALRLLAAEAALGAIAEAHRQGEGPAGMVDGYCIECQFTWPCPTSLWATGQRESNAPWNPADDEPEALGATS